MTALIKHIIWATVGGLCLFVLAVFSSKAIGSLLGDEFGWLEQVILKLVLILISWVMIRLVLKISLRSAGFQKSISKLNRWQVLGRGALLGAMATVLIFFTPAMGNPLVRSMNPLEFFLIIVVWSSLSEEIFMRGLIQSYLLPFSNRMIDIGKAQISISVLVTAGVFSCMHLSLLFAGVDLWTVAITLVFTFLLGIQAGIFRERYHSIFPSFLTHVAFNLGGIGMGIVLGIADKILSGGFPPN